MVMVVGVVIESWSVCNVFPNGVYLVPSGVAIVSRSHRQFARVIVGRRWSRALTRDQ